jgi:hypothetical protein
MPQVIADNNQRAARDAMNAVGVATGAVVLDLREYFCPDGLCVTQIGDTYLYRDDGHISVGAAQGLKSTFEAVIR